MKYIIVASHRRSGTHWLIDTIFNNLSDVHHGYFDLDTLLSYEDQKAVDVFLKCDRKISQAIVLKTHTLGDFDLFKPRPQLYKFIQEHILPNAKTVYIFRDGRDVMSSLYHFYTYKKSDKELSFKDFILSQNNYDSVCGYLNRIEFYCHHVRSWIQKENILTVRYEDMHASYQKTLGELSSYFGLPQKQHTIVVGLKKYNQVQRMVRRFFPMFFRATAVLPRKGVIGDWQNHFDQQSREIFKKNSNNLLLELGYVSDDLW